MVAQGVLGQQPTNVQHPNTTMQHPSNVTHTNTAMQHSNNVQHPNKVRRTATGRAAPPAAGRAKLPAAEAAKLQAVRRGQLHRAGHVSLDSGDLLPDEVAKIEALEALLAREPVAELLPDEVAKIEALRALLALEPLAEGTYINDDKELEQDPMEDLVVGCFTNLMCFTKSCFKVDPRKKTKHAGFPVLKLTFGKKTKHAGFPVLKLTFGKKTKHAGFPVLKLTFD